MCIGFLKLSSIFSSWLRSVAFELGGVFLTLIVMLVFGVCALGVLEGANLLYSVLFIFLRGGAR